MDILSQRKLLTRLVILLVLLNLSLLLLFGWRYINREPKDRPGKPDNTELSAILKKELGLSEAQADSLKKYRSLFFEKEQILSAATRAKRDSMNQLMFSEGNNDSTLKSLAAAVSNNEYQMELLRIEQAAQIRSICHPEQLKKLNKIILEIRDYLKPETDNK